MTLKDILAQCKLRQNHRSFLLALKCDRAEVPRGDFSRDRGELHFETGEPLEKSRPIHLSNLQHFVSAWQLSTEAKRATVAAAVLDGRRTCDSVERGRCVV